MSSALSNLGSLVRIRTGKLDANANDPDGLFPFFTCAREPLRIATHSYDCECVLVAGNGDLNVKYFNGKFDAYQRTYIIESLNSSVLDVRYLYHFMDTYLDKLRHMSIGGVIKYIKIGNLTEAELPLPTLPEQRRIAAILDQADALRAKRREALAQLDSLTQSIFIEMFGDARTDSGRWPLIPFDDIVSESRIGLVRGSHELDPAHPYPYLRMNAITRDGDLKLEGALFAKATSDELALYQLRRDDFLFNTRNSKELVGKTALFRSDEQYLFNNNLLRVRFKNAANAEYVLAAFKTPFIQSELENRKSGTTNVFAVYYKDLKTLPMPLPPIKLQEVFGHWFSSIPYITC